MWFLVKSKFPSTTSLLIVVLLWGLIVGGCRKSPISPEEPPQNGRFIPSERTKFPSQAGNLTSAEISENMLRLVYSGNLPQFQPGDILVGTTGQGYLKKVSSVQRQGNTLTILTAEAKFTEAFKSAYLDTVIRLSPKRNELMGFSPKKLEKIQTLWMEGKPYTVQVSHDRPIFLPNVNIQGKDYDFAWDFPRFGIEVTDANGDLAFSLRTDTLTLGMNLQIDFKLDESNWEVNHLRLAKIEDQGLVMKNVSLQGKRSFSAEIRKVTLLDIPILTSFPVGFIVFTVGLNADFGIEASLNLEAQSNFNLVASANYHTETGAEWRNGGWHQVDDKEVTAKAEILGYTASGAITWEVESFVEMSADVSLYAVLGPEFFLRPYFSASISLPPPACETAFGLRIGARLSLNLFDLPLFEFTAADYRQTLSQWCESELSNRWLLGGPIQEQEVSNDGEVFYTNDLEIDVAIGDKLILAGSSELTAQYWVDDLLILQITSDQHQETYTFDFSYGCSGWITYEQPTDITSKFRVGRNHIQVSFQDKCGVFKSASEIWLGIVRKD